MHKIYFYLIIGLSFVSQSCKQDKQLKITGKLTNLGDSIITVVVGSDIITGIESKGYQKDYRVNKDGSFFIPINTSVPVDVFIYGNNYKFSANVRLLENGEITLSADCDNYPESLKFRGVNGAMNTFLFNWNEFNNNSRKEIGESIITNSRFEEILDSLQTVSLKMLNDFNAKNILRSDELLFLKSEINYRKYLSLVYLAYGLRVLPNDSLFHFFKDVDIYDNEACLVSNTYNDLILSYILYELNSKGIFHSDFDDNQHFFQTYYKTINEKFTGKVKDVMLSRFVSDLLNGYNDLALEFYKKYLNDCNSPQMVEKTKNLYEDYIKTVNEQLSEEVIIVPTYAQSPTTVLGQFKNKVVYLDFWASWCSPCIEGLPYAKKIEEHYENRGLIVIYIGNKDKRSSLINAIKKYNIDGYHIILNEEETEVWRKEFNISETPSYILINKEGNVVNLNAPHPNEEEIYSQIDKLL